MHKRATIEFEWDELKNISNQDKHGVSFEEAMQIWNDNNLIIVPGKHRGEKREVAIGKAYIAIFSVVHTRRGDKIRIISARLASKKERKQYGRCARRIAGRF